VVQALKVPSSQGLAARRQQVVQLSLLQSLQFVAMIDHW
jgi:hypothetical protein